MPRKAVEKAVDLTDSNAYVLAQVGKYQERNRVLQEIVDRGDRVRATATGQEQLDLRTCTCKSFGSRRKDHAQDCQVQIVLDPTPRIAAIKEMRLNDARLDALRQQMVPPDQSEDMQLFLKYIEDQADENKRVKAENESLRRQLDAAYAELRAVPADMA